MMHSSLKTVSSALDAIQQNHTLITRNISSSIQAGHKKCIACFSGQEIGGLGSSKKQLDDERIQTLEPIADAVIDLTPGILKTTGSPYDFALTDDGLFEIQGKAGALYTRNGNFQLNQEGQLVDPYGRAVMGPDGPIQLIPGGGPLHSDRYGQLFQGSQRVGQLKIVDIPSNRLIVAAGGFIIDPDRYIDPQVIERPSVMHGSLECSNYSIHTGMVDLISTSRQQEVLQHCLQAHDKQEEEAVKAFGKLA